MNKVCVGIIASDFVRTKTIQTLLFLAKLNANVAGFIIKQGPLVHLNRDHIVLDALKGGYTHLFFVDSDVSFSQEVLDKLLAEDKDIIGAPYNMRTFPLQTTVKFKGEIPLIPFKCDALGTGCMLIKMDVFRKLDRPWFFFEPQTETSEGEGEDVWFCKKAREAGYEIWCQPQLQVSHIGEFNY